jgi:DNA adenine methylase
MKTPIRYAGGKSKAYKKINEYLPFFPKPKRIVSPFIGGGSLEVRWASEQNIPVLGFDVFWCLTNYWKYQIEQPEELYNILVELKCNKEEYERIKNKLQHWDKVQDLFKDWPTEHYKRENKSIDNLSGAAYFFHNHNLSFGPNFLGWFSSVYNDEQKYKKMIERVKDFKCNNLKVEHKSFEQVIPSFSNDFLYLDPPYYMKKDSDNKMFSGLYPNNNWPVHHDNFDHELLRDLLHNHKGSFILSYNNCETIREYYRDFKQVFPDWQYSFGQGEVRIGKNRTEGKVTKESHEILIIKE